MFFTTLYNNSNVCCNIVCYITIFVTFLTHNNKNKYFLNDDNNLAVKISQGNSFRNGDTGLLNIE